MRREEFCDEVVSIRYHNDTSADSSLPSNDVDAAARLASPVLVAAQSL